MRQAIDNEWVLTTTKGSFTHECCDCGLRHKVHYQIKNGWLYTMWTRIIKKVKK